MLGLMALGLSDGLVTVSSGESGVGGERPHITSVYNQSMIQTIVMLVLAAWFLAISCGMVVIRDLELQVVEVFHSTRLTAREYVWGKFAGTVALFMAIWLLFPGLSMFLIHVVEASGGSETIGDFALGNYLFPTLLFGLPQILFFAGIPFFLGTWTRRPNPGLRLSAGGAPGHAELIRRLVPELALARGQPHPHAPRPVGLPVAGRDVPQGRPGGGVLQHGAAPPRPGVRAQPGGPGDRGDWPPWRARPAPTPAGRCAGGTESRILRRFRRRRARPAAPASPKTESKATLSDLAMTTLPLGFRRAAGVIARSEIRDLVVRPGMYLFVPLILYMAFASTLLAIGPFNSRILLTPGAVADRQLNTLNLLICFLLLFYTVESLHKERSRRMHEIFSATPVGTGAVLLGKSLGNSAMAAFILLVALLGDVVIISYQQLFAGSPVGFDVVPFIATWGSVLIPTFIFWTALVTALFSLFRSRYMVYGLGFGLIIYTVFSVRTGESMTWRPTGWRGTPSTGATWGPSRCTARPCSSTAFST